MSNDSSSNETGATDAQTTLSALRALGQLPPQTSHLDKDLTLTLSPREEGLAHKDVPVDTLAKKVIGVRDKLRVLEQRINSSKLNNAEKIAVEHHITGLYDALAGMMAFFSDDAWGPLDAPQADASDGGSSESTGEPS